MRIPALLLISTFALIAGEAGAADGRMTAPIAGDAKAASVFDGDSFTLGGQHIHLAGIDAPELGQLCPRERAREARCGLMAGYELRKRLQLGQQPLRCWPQGPARDGALVATCASGEDDVAMQLLDIGYAWALPDAQIDYRLAEEKTRAAGLGLWARGITAPWDWRKERENAAAQGPDEGCVIAGTIEDSGARPPLLRAARSRLWKQDGQAGERRTLVLQRGAGTCRRLAPPGRRNILSACFCRFSAARSAARTGSAR